MVHYRPTAKNGPTNRCGRCSNIIRNVMVGIQSDLVYSYYSLAVVVQS